jgi:hypothetical protein
MFKGGLNQLIILFYVSYYETESSIEAADLSQLLVPCASCSPRGTRHEACA